MGLQEWIPEGETTYTPVFYFPQDDYQNYQVQGHTSLNLRNWAARNQKRSPREPREQPPVITRKPELATVGAREPRCYNLQKQPTWCKDGLHFISASQEGPALSGQRICKGSFWLSSSCGAQQGEAGRDGIWAADGSSHTPFTRYHIETFHTVPCTIPPNPYVADNITHIVKTRQWRFQEKGGQWLLTEHLRVPTYC